MNNRYLYKAKKRYIGEWVEIEQSTLCQITVMEAAACIHRTISDIFHMICRLVNTISMITKNGVIGNFRCSWIYSRISQKRKC